jgi:hypothetical protein
MCPSKAVCRGILNIIYTRNICVMIFIIIIVGSGVLTMFKQVPNASVKKHRKYSYFKRNYLHKLDTPNDKWKNWCINTSTRCCMIKHRVTSKALPWMLHVGFPLRKMIFSVGDWRVSCNGGVFAYLHNLLKKPGTTGRLNLVPYVQYDFVFHSPWFWPNLPNRVTTTYGCGYMIYSILVGSYLLIDFLV